MQTDKTQDGNGFIQRPSLGPSILSIAVFHQLHCLDTFWHLIYTSNYSSNAPVATPWHVTHCLEYLRNVLLCHADGSFEYTQHSKEESGEVAGFEKHMCRNSREVVAFAEKWRVYDGKGGDERRPIGEGY